MNNYIDTSTPWRIIIDLSQETENQGAQEEVQKIQKDVQKVQKKIQRIQEKVQEIQKEAQKVLEEAQKIREYRISALSSVGASPLYNTREISVRSNNTSKGAQKKLQTLNRRILSPEECQTIQSTLFPHIPPNDFSREQVEKICKETDRLLNYSAAELRFVRDTLETLSKGLLPVENLPSIFGGMHFFLSEHEQELHKTLNKLVAESPYSLAELFKEATAEAEPAAEPRVPHDGCLIALVQHTVEEALQEHRELQELASKLVFYGPSPVDQRLLARNDSQVVQDTMKELLEQLSSPTFERILHSIKTAETVGLSKAYFEKPALKTNQQPPLSAGPRFPAQNGIELHYLNALALKSTTQPMADAAKAFEAAKKSSIEKEIVEANEMVGNARQSLEDIILHIETSEEALAAASSEETLRDRIGVLVEQEKLVGDIAEGILGDLIEEIPPELQRIEKKKTVSRIEAITDAILRDLLKEVTVDLKKKPV